MGLSFGSINTGLPKDIVKQLMAVERTPITRMEARKSNHVDRKKLVDELITLFKDLRSKLQANSTDKMLRELKVETDEDLIDVVLDNEIAEPGEFRFGVDRMAQKSSAFSSGFADPDESYIGVGFIQYYLPDGEVKEVYIDPSHASLRGVAELINADPLNGMRAFIINDGFGYDNPWRLLISLDHTGDEYEAQFPFFYFVDGVDDFYLEYEREAHDASVKLDGFDIELQKNEGNSNLIPGVTIDLLEANPDKEFSIKIKVDRDAIAEKVKGIIEDINKILKFIITQNQLDANSNTFKTLGGDVSLQTVEYQLRSLVFQPIESTFGSKRLSDLGVAFQRDGLLKFDEKLFKARLAENYQQVIETLVGYFDFDDEVKVPGFINKFYDISNSIIRPPFGVLSNRSKGIQSIISQIDRQIQDRERMLDMKEKSLKEKFARLEGTVSKLKAQQGQLAAMGGSSQMTPMPQLG